MAGEDPEYTEWLRHQPCCMCGTVFGVQVHHRTGAGVSLRASDLEGMPLCHVDHTAFHAATGRFKGWGREQRSSWQDAMIREHRARYNDTPVAAPY